MTLLDARIPSPPSDLPEENEQIPGLYDPDSGMIACVIIHAAHGIRDRRVNNLFSSRDWFLGVPENMVLMRAPLHEWRRVASMPREERPNLRGGKIGDSPC